jgi:hypothetical protein
LPGAASAAPGVTEPDVGKQSNKVEKRRRRERYLKRKRARLMAQREERTKTRRA